jgi:hypothetical protein
MRWRGRVWWSHGTVSIPLNIHLLLQRRVYFISSLKLPVKHTNFACTLTISQYGTTISLFLKRMEYVRILVIWGLRYFNVFSLSIYIQSYVISSVWAHFVTNISYRRKYNRPLICYTSYSKAFAVRQPLSNKLHTQEVLIFPRELHTSTLLSQGPPIFPRGPLSNKLHSQGLLSLPRGPHNNTLDTQGHLILPCGPLINKLHSQGLLSLPRGPHSNTLDTQGHLILPCGPLSNKLHNQGHFILPRGPLSNKLHIEGPFIFSRALLRNAMFTQWLIIPPLVPLSYTRHIQGPIATLCISSNLSCIYIQLPVYWQVKIK